MNLNPVDIIAWVIVGFIALIAILVAINLLLWILIQLMAYCVWFKSRNRFPKQGEIWEDANGMKIYATEIYKDGRIGWCTVHPEARSYSGCYSTFSDSPEDWKERYRNKLMRPAGVWSDERLTPGQKSQQIQKDL